MAHILSDGQPVIRPIPLQQHLANLEAWMADQKPRVCAAREGLRLDITSDNIIYLLQPTRVIARKRIQKNCHLIGALLQYPKFRQEFEENPYRHIVLHITGPTPIEHRADLETVLRALDDVYTGVPDSISDRLFLAFSVGNEEHPCFPQKGFRRLSIEEIYRMATAVLFPSETEGRGLPIGEASASEVPIICSRYSPEEVFAEVVGEHLQEEERILYTIFPEDGFPESFLAEVTEILLHPKQIKSRIAHNKRAARLRYGKDVMKKIFVDILTELANTQ
jgi:glycosyltransferase involved in cell wall biosynthesis